MTRWIAVGALALAMPASAQTVTARTTPPPEPPAPPTAQMPPQGTAPVLADRITRARDNLVALREGRRSVAELTPEELQDVVAYERRLHGDAVFDARSFRQRCIDAEVKRAGGQPSELEWTVIRLKCRD